MARHVEKTEKSLTACFGELLTSGLFFDISFGIMDSSTMSEEKIGAHKLVLAARSPVFQAMFYGPCAEKGPVIELPDTDPQTFRLFLKYLYTDETELTEDAVSGVAQLAHKYQIDSLLNYCFKYLKQVLNPENACTILQLALFLGEKTLEKETIVFIDENAEKVLKCDSFYDISLFTLSYILKGDTFYAPEKSIVNAALEWARRNCLLASKEVTGQNIRGILGEAFRYLRLPTLTAADFSKLTYRQGLLSFEETEETVSFITGNNEAKPFNLTPPRRKKVDTIRPKHFETILEGQIQFVKQKSVKSVIRVKAFDDLKLTEFKLSGLTKSAGDSCFITIKLAIGKTLTDLNLKHMNGYVVNIKTLTEGSFPFMGPIEIKKDEVRYITCCLLDTANSSLMVPHLKNVSASAAESLDPFELDEILMKDMYGIKKGIKMLEVTYMDTCRVLESIKYECPDKR